HKAYIPHLVHNTCQVLYLTSFPYRIKALKVRYCQFLEDIVFSQDNRTWYLTCMGSSVVIMGDATNDKPLKTISAPPPGPPFIRYPHGISIHNGIDRVMITSTVRTSDFGDAGETVTVLEASTGRVCSTGKGF